MNKVLGVGCLVLVFVLALHAQCQEAAGKPKASAVEAPTIKVKPLKPLMHNGKPIFPIGAYGVPIDVDLPTLRKEGWNTVLDQGAATHSTDEMLKWLSDLQKAGLVGIIGLGNLVREDKDAEVFQVVQALDDHRALLGYYLFDEPENHFYESGKTDLKDLHMLIRRKIGWAHQTVRAAESHPDHYTFGCIAWWTEYRNLQPLCDVNMPNEYPSGNTKVEFEGKWPNVVYDAKLANEAAQANGGLGFVYTPMAVNSRAGIEMWRSPTANEFRYSAFAPITQGAMGVVFWAAYRCTKPYAEEVVFPVTRQLSALTPFFLGEWLDDKLVCEPSDSPTDLLKEYKLPAVSGCLRLASDGRYLLLAVNNTPQPVNATFRLSLKNLPSSAQDSLTGKKSPIKNGVIKDTFPAYGVRAYVFSSK
ncbi:MAG TPA: hypothetical protein VFI02_20915 [Armatimonadota bacterium]|nr:hypothetical protein [Armatimonadota bacterium]